METPPPDRNLLLSFRRTTRSALSEIPTRMSLLTMGDTRLDSPSPTTGENTNVTLALNVSTNLPTSYLSPAPSPDEMIIQQRGRRRLPVQWSPDVLAAKAEGQGRNDRTPVKGSPNKSSIVLRSTPRKRLLLTDPRDINGTPEKQRKMSPNAKKSKYEKSASSYTGPVQAALKGLSQEQLIDLIQNLVEKHPGLEDEIREILPQPDIKPLEEKLNYLKKNIFKSLPSSRLTSKTDSPAYSRAATHVIAFKKCVLEQGRQLMESQHWDAVMDYVMMAWNYTRATPLWDNPPHNAARRHCFKSLSSQCMAALKRGNWSKEQLQEFKMKFESFSYDCEDMKACATFVQNTLLSM